MLISTFVDSVLEDLRSLGELGGEALAATSARLASALESPLRTRFLEAVNQLVADRNADGSQFEIRLAGDDVSLVVRESPAAPLESPSEFTARVALRLSDEAKTRIEDRATNEGLSTNAWIVRALQGALEKSTAAAARSGRQLKGTGVS
jgi:predicted HicB family RNase H-like nuclease